MRKPKCPYCHGLGEDMVGVMMHANPSSYSDYDEVWEECTACNGTGASWRHGTGPLLHELWFRLKKGTMPPEDEIPF